MEKINLKAALLAATFLSGAGLVQPALAQTDEELMDRALAAEGQEYWAAAERFYRQVLERDPSQGHLWERLADIIAKQGRALEAAEALSKAANIDTSNADLQSRTARAFAAANAPERALEYMNRALEIDSENQFFLESKAANETWLGRYAEAEQSLRSAFAQGLAETEENLLRLAKLQQWQNKLDDSLETLRRVNRINPENLEYLVLLTRLSSWRGDFKHALESIDEYRARGGDPVIAAREKAVILAWADKPEASLATSEPALAEAPDDVPLLIGQAIAYSRARDYETSFGIIERLEALTGGTDEIAELRRILEAPVRSNVEVNFTASTDRDNITFYGGQTIATIALKRGTYLRFGGEGYHMTAIPFSGLDRIDNVGSIVKTGAFAELEVPLSNNVWAIVKAGGSFTDYGPSAFQYDVRLRARTGDNTWLTFGANRDLFTVSPRSLSLGIINNQYFFQFDHTPDLDWYLQGRIEYNDLNDGNRKIQGEVTAIKSVMRRARYNLSIGLNGQWFGFDLDLANGYYDPSFYQRYLVPFYLNYKFNDDDNIVFTIAPGMHKDNSFAKFQFAGAASAELTLGLYRDWFFKAKFGAYLGGGSAINMGANYWVVAGNARLVRRF